MPESTHWLNNCIGTDSFSNLERDALNISTICNDASGILQRISNCEESLSSLLSLVQRMRALDDEATQWRQSSTWAYKTVRKEANAELPIIHIEIHPDLWMIYEWNYHRAARITLHHQLVACVSDAEASPQADKIVLEQLRIQKDESIKIIRSLADQVLATVPQSLGDLTSTEERSNETTGSRAIGAYFLLWPIKIMKAQTASTSPKQKQASAGVFERIREYTGMKQNLGSLSLI